MHARRILYVVYSTSGWVAVKELGEAKCLSDAIKFPECSKPHNAQQQVHINWLVVMY